MDERGLADAIHIEADLLQLFMIEDIPAVKDESRLCH
jgi:hypothetical protein